MVLRLNISVESRFIEVDLSSETVIGIAKILGITPRWANEVKNSGKMHYKYAVKYIRHLESELEKLKGGVV